MINLIDRHKGEFLRGGLVYGKDSLNPIQFAQDPTYLSFHVEFFFPEDVASPDTASSAHEYYISDDFLVHEFSHNGLFLPPKYSIDTGQSTQESNTTNNPTLISKPNVGAYNFTDSAEDYLYAIGAVNKLASLRSFKRMLYSLQKETPWYFQKITGGESLYTLDPKVNTKKEGVLTFECLESIDQRVSLLADLYRQAAWDFERHREVLPYNLRTFKMKIHVFEMRNFNTYSGTIANFLKNSSDTSYNQQLKEYWSLTPEERVSVTAPVDNQGLAGQSTARGAGGSGNTGQTAASVDLKSAFNAISVRTYELSHCEFDFYSTAPSYLADLQVAEVPMANFTFKIKYATARAISDYPFYRFLLDSVVADSKFPTNVGTFPNTVSPGNIRTLNSFYEPGGTTELTPYDQSAVAPGQANLNDNFNQTIKNRFESEKTIRDQFPASRRNGGLGGLVLGALESRFNTAVQGLVSRVNSTLLGNAYDNIPSPGEVAGALRGFLAGERTFSSGSLPTNVTPANIGFDNLTVDPDIIESGMQPLPVDGSITESGMVDLPVDSSITQSMLEPLSTLQDITQSGLTPLSTDTTISESVMGSLPVDNSISNSSFEPLGIIADISPGAMQTPPAPSELNADIGGFDELSTNDTISSSVNFSRPPSQPQISPKNIFGRS
jgi:hypothetical protein